MGERVALLYEWLAKWTGVSLSLVLTAGVVLQAPPVAAEHPAIVGERVAKAKASVKQVEMSVLKAVVDEQRPVLILDVREPHEFDRGHIPGAVNLPRGLLEFKIWKMVGGEPPDTSRMLYIYCATAARSALAAETLTQLGFSHVYLVEMQLEEWKRAGYPLKSSAL